MADHISTSPTGEPGTDRIERIRATCQRLAAKNLDAQWALMVSDMEWLLDEQARAQARARRLEFRLRYIRGVAEGRGESRLGTIVHLVDEALAESATSSERD